MSDKNKSSSSLSSSSDGMIGSNSNNSSLLLQHQQLQIQEKQLEIISLKERLETLTRQLQQQQQQQQQNNNNGSIDIGTVSSSGSSNNTMKTNTTQTTSTKNLDRDGKRRNFISMSLDAVNVREVSCGSGGAGGINNGKKMITAQRERIGRHASIATQNVLHLLSMEEKLRQSYDSDYQTIPPVIQRVMAMFDNPTQHMDYLNSQTFAKDLLKLCRAVRHRLDKKETQRVVFLQSPAYVFGDIHGNLEDLHFFSDNIWRLGMSLTAGNFLFLGDYVDRGLSCLETISYLLAMKQQLPTKVHLLRGNHETRDVNGWEEHYGERSFIWQCRNRFGDDLGYRVWEACNSVFDRLPLAAVIDQDIFCVHGGIPRPISANTTRIQDILNVPTVAGINPPYEHEDDNYQQVASDCIWSDPASEEQEMTTVDPETGFGESLRGGGAICFGNKAVTDFLSQQDFSYIMRAHEAHADGVAVSKGARVFTVFSTSQDHNQGSHAMAGCILVDNDKLQVINRSPACTLLFLFCLC
jgi:diadenosine tetraphosphatase ApaH/serine/threonine PP2A family protein phosphatase